MGTGLESETSDGMVSGPDSQQQAGSGVSGSSSGKGVGNAGVSQTSNAESSTRSVNDGSGDADAPQGADATPGSSFQPDTGEGAGGTGGAVGSGPGGADDGSNVTASAGINLASKDGSGATSSKKKQTSTTTPSGSHDNNVCLGGILKCQAGAAPSPIMVMPITGMFANMIQPVANIMDFMANQNIMSFAVCMSPLHPGFIMGGPQSCSPMVTPWIPSDLATLMAGLPPASSKDHCICMIAPGMQVKIMFPGTFNLYSLS